MRAWLHNLLGIDPAAAARMARLSEETNAVVIWYGDGSHHLVLEPISMTVAVTALAVAVAIKLR